MEKLRDPEIEGIQLSVEEISDAIREAKLVKFFRERNKHYWQAQEQASVQKGIEEKEERRKGRIRNTMKADNFVNKPVYRK